MTLTAEVLAGGLGDRMISLPLLPFSADREKQLLRHDRNLPGRSFEPVSSTRRTIFASNDFSGRGRLHRGN